jgi:hypothetical protein
MQGGPPLTSPTPVVAAVGPAASTHQGAHHRCFAKLGTCHQNFSCDTYLGGHHGKQYHYKQATWRKNGGKSFDKKKIGSLRCKNPGVIIPLQKSKSTDSATTLSIIGITERGGKATVGRKVYASSGSRSNRSATVWAASSTPSLIAFADPSRALAPQAPGRCWGHSSGSTLARGQPPPVLEHDLPPPGDYRQPPPAGIFPSQLSPEGEVRRWLLVPRPLPG